MNPQRQSYFSFSSEGVPIRNIADYSPFGVQLDGRTMQGDFYRYGFQNQEKDDEIKGAGNSVNYKYRMHDPRVGRFFAVDPLISSYPFYSSYSFSGNRVINSVELEGKEDKNCFYWLDPSLASFRNQNSYQVNKQCEKAFKEGMSQSAAIGGAILVDIFITKGAISTALFYSALGQSMNATDRYHEAKSQGNDVQAKEYKKEMEETGKEITVFGIARLGGYFISKGMSSFAKSSIRKQLSSDFYKQSGYEGARAESHMSGIDFTKPVSTVTLKKGTEVQQWVGSDGKVGNYFSPVGTDPTKIGIDINAKGGSLKVFTLTEDVKVLQSTAKNFQGNDGGGTQFFSTLIKNKIK